MLILKIIKNLIIINYLHPGILASAHLLPNGACQVASTACGCGFHASVSVLPHGVVVALSRLVCARAHAHAPLA